MDIIFYDDFPACYIDRLLPMFSVRMIIISLLVFTKFTGNKR